ncbi:Holliday junction resolvase RuvX [Blattabacterium cuenoti]|uniref:Holliday junction resolvase RuvX n=1 Tax=Blattabacterium cuenoti TaxID=1653831 RepID=UPI00163C1478|nr:Holliday junction resolvase RuvX [Blattabacterium cuenoti]
MTKILGIDYGKVITGLSISDTYEVFSFGLKAVPTKELMSFLDYFVEKKKIKKIVIGLPKTLNNKISKIEKEIQGIISKLKEKHPKIIIDRIDERFTSKIALSTMIELGLRKKKRRKKMLLNKISAVLILQSYLLRKNKRK